MLTNTCYNLFDKTLTNGGWYCDHYWSELFICLLISLMRVQLKWTYSFFVSGCHSSASMFRIASHICESWWDWELLIKSVVILHIDCFSLSPYSLSFKVSTLFSQTLGLNFKLFILVSYIEHFHFAFVNTLLVNLIAFVIIWKSISFRYQSANSDHTLGLQIKAWTVLQCFHYWSKLLICATS